MKHLRLMSLAAGMLLSLSALPLSAAFAVEAGFYDDLRNSKWHDGFVFYYPENHTPKSQNLKFAGGTMHEGGYEATLTDLNYNFPNPFELYTKKLSNLDGMPLCRIVAF